MGCDDIAAASWVVPALTTVAQQKAEMGRMAVERIAAALDDPENAGEAETIRIPMILRIRESTGPAPAGAAPGMTARLPLIRPRPLPVPGRGTHQRARPRRPVP